MARPLRIEYEGAVHHIVNRGSGRGAIFRDDVDRQRFLESVGDACQKTGWQVHAWVLMSNHRGGGARDKWRPGVLGEHLVLETPKPNLGLGLKWLLGTYTQRFNLRHRRPGHLFQGRDKAQLIDERSPSYLRTACDYVHLNPVRARLLRPLVFTGFISIWLSLFLEDKMKSSWYSFLALQPLSTGFSSLMLQAKQCAEEIERLEDELVECLVEARTKAMSSAEREGFLKKKEKFVGQFATPSGFADEEFKTIVMKFCTEGFILDIVITAENDDLCHSEAFASTVPSECQASSKRVVFARLGLLEKLDNYCRENEIKIAQRSRRRR